MLSRALLIHNQQERRRRRCCDVCMCSLTQFQLSSHHRITLKRGKDYKIMSQSEKLFVLKYVSGAVIVVVVRVERKKESSQRTQDRGTEKERIQNAHVNCENKNKHKKAELTKKESHKLCKLCKHKNYVWQRRATSLRTERKDSFCVLKRCKDMVLDNIHNIYRTESEKKRSICGNELMRGALFYTQNLCEMFSKWGYLEHTLTLAENNIQFQQLPRAVFAMFNTFLAPWRRRRLPQSMHTWFPFQPAQSCCLVDSTRIQNISQRRLLCLGTMKTYNFHLSWNEWRKKTRKWNRKIFSQTAAKKYSKKNRERENIHSD